MNGQANPVEQDVHSRTTLGRKELISILKQRYGNEVDGFRTSDVVLEKETILQEKQKEHDPHHVKQIVPDNNSQMNQLGGFQHSPTINGNWDHFSGTGSEGSDDSLPMGRQRRPHHGKFSKHTIMRRSDSEEDGSRDGSTERLPVPPAKIFNNGGENMLRSKGVTFLQYLDDVKRVTLPAAVTSVDTINALFVNSFPNRISMQDFECGRKIVYIKDFDTGTYYMLEDVSDVTNHCFLKIHEKQCSNQSRGEAQFTNMESVSVKTPTTIISDNGYSVETPKLHRNVSHMPNGSTSIHHNSNNVNQNQVTTNSFSELNPNNVSSQNQIQVNNCSPERTQNTALVHGIINNKFVSPKVGSLDTRRVDNMDTIALQNISENYNPCSNKTQVATTGETRGSAFKGRANSCNSISSTTESVEDQLDDLSELLKHTLEVKPQAHQEEEIECVNIKNPGKLSKRLVENIQHETETLARRKVLPKHFTPTIMVAAQQESNRRNCDGDPPKVAPKPKLASVKMKSRGLSRSSEEEDCAKLSSSIVSENEENSDKERSSLPAEGCIESPNRIQFESKAYLNGGHEENSVTEPVEDQVRLISTPPRVKMPDTQLELQCTQEGDVILTPDVNAISNLSLAGKSEHSSSGSLCSKSSTIPNSVEKLNDIDELKQENTAYEPHPVENVYADMSGTYKDTSDTYKDSTVPRERSDTTGESDLVVSSRCDRKDEVHSSTELIRDNAVSEEPPSKQHIYASISKVTDVPTHSRITTTFSSTTYEEKEHKRVSFRVNDFDDLAENAKCVHASLKRLRQDLSDLRKFHTDGMKSFKADLQKKLLEFRKKASRMEDMLHQKLDINNKIIFADKHPVRERRHRLSEDQLVYNNKMSNTELSLNCLEDDMENVRLSVVSKKYVEDPEKLKELHEELTQLTKGLAEIKNRFHGLHDMLNVVIPDELRIISNEERFLKEEPEKLDGLVARCKVLSGTLFTLERLASVQLEQRGGQQQPPPQQQQQQQQPQSKIKTVSSPKSAASYNYNQLAPFNDAFNIDDLKDKRNAHFNHKK